MGRPFTFGHFHIREDRLKRRVLRAAGVDAKADGAATLVHMADPHLTEILAVHGTLDAIIVFPTAEAVPHRPDGRIHGCGGPVGISQVRHHTAQMLELLVFVFY